MHRYMPTISLLASKCDHVTEFGVREGQSTFALLNAKTPKIISYDLQHSTNAGLATKLAAIENVDYTFIIGNTIEIEIEPTDLLMIDSNHTYEHLTKELQLHAGKVRKYLLFHDTVSAGKKDHRPGYKGPPIAKQGLLLAISEFMGQHPEWTCYMNFDGPADTYGMIILEKQQ